MDSEWTVEQFVRLLCNAAKHVEDRYFCLSRSSCGPAYRERVYCYELYHQMRKLWPEKCGHYLNGEVDKAGNSRFPESLGRAKPDFLIHDPGSMSRNLVVVEVKSIQSTNQQLYDDIRKLALFCTAAQYKAGVLLVYGGDPKEERIKRMTERASLHFKSGKFFLVSHEISGDKASVVGTYTPADASPCPLA